MVIELTGDVGAGKTTLSQGIAKGLGFSGEVPSPTFTLSRQYPVRGGRQLHHVDLYRLQGHDLMTDAVAAALRDPDAIVLVEWAAHGDLTLPLCRLRIAIEPQAKEAERRITVTSLDPDVDYIVEGLQDVYRHKN